MRDFVEEQMAFYAHCHQHMADLQRSISGYDTFVFICSCIVVYCVQCWCAVRF
ncbi:unnamed protein product [Soboliphyme baturini]|uniref:BAR_3_WASP_bdg domain-containing protein n=1 Tax=Soboliphyme baturini TaxID=241478 RepID=A0A183ICM0_9BILA|nr:unnamed protein product [Soboliphyme baturini]